MSESQTFLYEIFFLPPRKRVQFKARRSFSSDFPESKLRRSWGDTRSGWSYRHGCDVKPFTWSCFPDT